jgi:energy-coupling factor transporter ATP-binding protein EcfA2
MPKQFRIDPKLEPGDVVVGTDGSGTSLLVGAAAEPGAQNVWFNASKEFVALVIGKRGSGKSHTLGTMVEALATTEARTSISTLETRRAVLLIDPMGNFWPTAIPVSSDGPPKVRRQWEAVQAFGCGVVPISAQIWLPAGFEQPTDAKGIRNFTLQVSDLDAQDWADLLKANLVRDPQGIALADVYDRVTDLGWTDKKNKFHPPKDDYTLRDMIDCVTQMREDSSTDHAAQTLRALTRTLEGFARMPLFSGEGTPLTDLLLEGTVSVLMLPLRVGHDLRRVLTRVLIRRILRERELASQIRQRLDVERADDSERGLLTAELRERIPKTVLAIDEAQELLGDEGGEARQALEDFCLLGRNYGLSLILATQRPTTGAISPKVRSQVDTCFVHRLLTQDDIDITYKNLLSAYPREVRVGDRSLQYPDLVRSLEIGQAVVTSSTMTNVTGQAVPSRLVVLNVRPRVTVHGGEVT